MDLLQGLQALLNLPMPVPQSIKLDRAVQFVTDRAKEYHRLRDNFIKQKGVKRGDLWHIDIGSPAHAELVTYELELANCNYQVGFLGPIVLPENFEISGKLLSALVSAGFVERPPDDGENCMAPDSPAIPAPPQLAVVGQ
jgi:hypothetical protein